MRATYGSALGRRWGQCLSDETCRGAGQCSRFASPLDHRRLGYTVLTAENGIEALSLMQNPTTGHVELLLTDVVMPHMSGKELADRVRALYPHTKILFTSAYTQSAIVHQGVLDEGVAMLQKPFTPSALARKLRQMLDQPEPTETSSRGAPCL